MRSQKSSLTLLRQCALSVALLLLNVTPLTLASDYGSSSAQATNLALNKTATQSSITSGGVASRAVDGNTDGNFANNSVAHTASETQPWWQVDLGVVANITTIEVWNRTDCCADRIKDFYVLVSDVPFTSTSLSASLSQAGVSNLRVTHRYPHAYSLTDHYRYLHRHGDPHRHTPLRLGLWH